MIDHAVPELSFTKPSTKVAISGSGNVAQFAALKLIELGASVLSLSDSKGSLVAPGGFSKADVENIGSLKLKGGSLNSLTDSKFTYYEGVYSFDCVFFDKPY